MTVRTTGKVTDSWSRSVVILAVSHPMAKRQRRQRYGGWSNHETFVKVKNLEMNHDFPAVELRCWSSREPAGRARPRTHARHASARIRRKLRHRDPGGVPSQVSRLSNGTGGERQARRHADQARVRQGIVAFLRLHGGRSGDQSRVRRLYRQPRRADAASDLHRVAREPAG